MNTATPLLLLLFILFFAQSNADLYGNPSSPPPSRVAGKDFPPQTFDCNDRFTKCFNKTIKCPKECPEFKPSDPKAKACFLDCNSPKCEAVCRRRKPNCDSLGAACYDPRFIGGDGIVFYFHGRKNQHFALVSDPNLQINAHFIGRRPEGRTRDNTWIQSLGLIFGSHTFSIGAKKVAKWNEDKDQLFLFYDDQPIFIPDGHLSYWFSSDYLVFVDRTAKVNSVTVKVPGTVEISVNVVPITKKDDRIHNYQIPADDCFAHLELQFKFFNLSEGVEGVLGKTYRPEFQNPVKQGVAMPIMGGEDKYKTSSLLSSDCKSCIFSPEYSPDWLVLDTPSAMDCTSKMGNGRGIVCRR